MEEKLRDEQERTENAKMESEIHDLNQKRSVLCSSTMMPCMGPLSARGVETGKVVGNGQWGHRKGTEFGNLGTSREIPKMANCKSKQTKIVVKISKQEDKVNQWLQNSCDLNEIDYRKFDDTLLNHDTLFCCRQAI